MIEVCRAADIIVACAGQARMITAAHVKPGAAVIDVGVSRTEAGIVGDVDFDAVQAIAGAITPMPRRHRPDDDRLPAREHPRRQRGCRAPSPPDHDLSRPVPACPACPAACLDPTCITDNDSSPRVVPQCGTMPYDGTRDVSGVALMSTVQSIDRAFSRAAVP